MMDEKQSKVCVPPENEINSGASCEELDWLEGFLALHNGSVHPGMSKDETYCRDREHFRPLLDDLLGALGFLTHYELLMLRSSSEFNLLQ